MYQVAREIAYWVTTVGSCAVLAYCVVLVVRQRRILREAERAIDELKKQEEE